MLSTYTECTYLRNQNKIPVLKDLWLVPDSHQSKKPARKQHHNQMPDLDTHQNQLPRS
jgi:hypothetical protein